ncbi:MAG: hypothetical protein HY652_00875 [Acidobacteria bacterium]|nr:hypothetical protein [Acidobacteriota bacterium]
MRNRSTQWTSTWAWICLLALGTEARAWSQEESEMERKLHIAATQHEIVELHVKKGEYDRVLPELRKILELRFPPGQEQRVVKEIEFVADQLKHKGKYDLGHQVVEEGLKFVSTNESKAHLYKVRGFLYKMQGNEDKALQMFKQSLLEEKKRDRKSSFPWRD